VPIVSWLGVGNLVSVLFPVGDEPLIHRWEQRRDRRATIRWIAHLVLPYALYYVADPTGGIEHNVFWRQVPRAIAPILGRESRSFVHIGIAAAVWAIATAVAVLFFSGRRPTVTETQKQAEQPRTNVPRRTYRDLSGGVDVLGDNDLLCADVLNGDRCGAFHILRPHTNSSLTLSAGTSPSVDSSATLGS
jgi:hypothetical protein